jgi:hypothetical protein
MEIAKGALGHFPWFQKKAPRGAGNTSAQTRSQRSARALRAERKVSDRGLHKIIHRTRLLNGRLAPRRRYGFSQIGRLRVGRFDAEPLTADFPHPDIRRGAKQNPGEIIARPGRECDLRPSDHHLSYFVGDDAETIGRRSGRALH